MFGATRVDALGGMFGVGAAPAADGATLADTEPAQHVIASPAATITTSA